MNNSEIRERILQEVAELDKIVEKNEQFLQQIQLEEARPYQEAIVSALALNIHSFYTGAERIFELISTKIDYRMPTGYDWHRQLLDQMSVSIPEVREAVISEETKQCLEEFRRFRHVVRSIYAYQLETSRVMELARFVLTCNQHFTSEVRQFCRSIGG